MSLLKIETDNAALLRARQRRVRIRQVGGDDGYQWCLVIDGRSVMSGMTHSEAKSRRRRFIESGKY